MLNRAHGALGSGRAGPGGPLHGPERANGAFGASSKPTLDLEMERAVGTGSFVWEPPGIVSWSDGLFELLGYEVGSVLPCEERLFAAVHREDRARLRTAWASFGEGEVEDVEFRVTPEQLLAPRYVRMRVRVEWVDDYVARVRGVLIDVTEAKQNQLALEEALLRADALEQATNSGSFLLRVEPMELTCSEGLQRVTQLERPHADTVAHLETVHPEDRARQEAWWAQLVQELSCEPLLIRTLSPEGGLRHLETRVSVTRSPTDGVERVVGTTVDVTERVDLGERLRCEGSPDAVGMLAAGIAHDFNNYLMVVESTVAVLEAMQSSSEKSSSESRDFADTARQALERCRGLTEQLLAVARARPLRTEMVDLRRVLANFRSVLSGVVQDRACLNLRLADEVARTRVDPRHLERMVTNLVANAADALSSVDSRTGRIEVTVHLACFSERQVAAPADVPPGRYACVSVVDNGGGIAIDDLATIFEPRVSTKGRSGTGLGLSLVAEMVRQNAGCVTVQRLDPGARFTLYFPLFDEPNANDSRVAGR